MKLEIIRILESIEKARSYKKKFGILKTNQNNHNLKEVFLYTYSPNYKYYLTADKSESYVFSKNSELDTREKRWEYFEGLADRLTNRRISGKNAKKKVNDFLSWCTDRERYWYIKIINRDLNIGVGPTTVKKIWFGIVPTIDVQKAVLYNKDKHEFSDNIVVEPKINGIRCLSFVTNENVECYSRNGERFYYFENYLKTAFEGNTENFVLDGELFANSWNKTLTAVQSGNSIEDVKYFLFDFMKQEDYFNRITENLTERKRNLDSFLNFYNHDSFVKIREHYIPSKHSEVMELFQKYVRVGYEGIVVKDLDSKYKFERSKDWLKVKAVDFDTFLCVNIEEGRGENEGKLGSLILKKKDGSTFKVGIGFSNMQREEFWESPPVGKYIEISFFSSRHKQSKADSPVFIRVREDIS